MMDKVNETEISPRNKKLIDFYESRLEIAPDTAFMKTQKKFRLGETQVRKITAKYSEYPKPSDYKKMVRDSEATGSLVADDVIDKDFNEEYGGLLTSNDMVLTVKSAVAMGYDIKGMFAEFLQSIIHDNIKELTGDTLISLKKNIPLRKTLEQQVKEKEAEAKIKEAERKIMKNETEMLDLGISQHIAKVGAQRIIGDEQSDNTTFSDDEIKNIKYNEDYEEMYNEAMNLILEASVSNNKAVLDFKKKQFALKWAYRNKKAEEIRQLRAERERREAEREVNEEQELEEILKGLSTEELAKLYNEQYGDINADRY